MTTLHPQDLLTLTYRLPAPLIALLKDIHPPLFVAGGYIRSVIAGEKINDIDIFADSKVGAVAIAKDLFNNWPNKAPRARLIETDNAVTLVGCGSFTIQFIHRWTFAKPQECVASFDFTIASAAFWWNSKAKYISEQGGWDSMADDNFYPDLAAKRLTYLFPIREEEAGGSMLRVLKFYQRGYRIPLDSLGGVIARLTRNVKNEPGDMIERKNAETITKRLREGDPLIDPDHISHLPSSHEPPQT